MILLNKSIVCSYKKIKLFRIEFMIKILRDINFKWNFSLFKGYSLLEMDENWDSLIHQMKTLFFNLGKKSWVSVHHSQPRINNIQR